jgi:hypothetical protein
MDYKTKLHEDITKLQLTIKNGYKRAKKSTTVCSLKSFAYRPNGLRLEKIEALTEDYFAKTGEMPDAVSLERMANLCIYEELADTNPDKITQEEFPIMSDTQLARRREGKHRKSEANYRIEVPFGLAENYGIDGGNYNQPLRRQRSERENRFVDKEAKIRNKQRKEAYDEFTKVQPVIIHAQERRV